MEAGKGEGNSKGKGQAKGQGKAQAPTPWDGAPVMPKVGPPPKAKAMGKSKGEVKGNGNGKSKGEVKGNGKGKNKGKDIQVDIPQPPFFHVFQGNNKGKGQGKAKVAGPYPVGEGNEEGHQRSEGVGSAKGKIGKIGMGKIGVGSVKGKGDVGEGTAKGAKGSLREEGYTKARPPTSTRSKARPPTSSI